MPPFTRYSQSKCAYIDLGAKAKYKYANRKVIQDFLFDSNSNVWSICYHLRDFGSEIKCEGFYLEN